LPATIVGYHTKSVYLWWGEEVAIFVGQTMWFFKE